MNDGSFTDDKKKALLAGYMRHAWEDLQESKALAGRHSESFHAQQAAEKFLMAILTSEDVHFNARDRGHNLDARVEALPDANPWKNILGKITFLQNYATTSRYPRPGTGRVNRIAMSEVARVRVARDKLEEVIATAARHFDLSLEFHLDVPAKNAAPYRGESKDLPPNPKPRA